MKQVLWIFLTVLLAACQGNSTRNITEDGDTLSLRYAHQLTIVNHEQYTEVVVKNPWKQGSILHRYFLLPKENNDERVLSDLQEVCNNNEVGGVKTNIVRIPVERNVIFTSPHCQLAYDLGCANAIVGVCDLDYINIKDVHRRAKADLHTPTPSSHPIIDCGNSMQPSLEKIIELNPEALMISPFENSGGYGKLATLGIPIIETADYMETSAMGRAEWMLFYGMLLGQEHTADSLFHLVDSTYQSLREMARQLPRGCSILTERKTGNVWYTPGGQSTMGIILADANASYPFANDKHNGSLALNPEQLLDKSTQVEVWAFKNFGKALSKEELLTEYQGYSLLKAFQTGHIYQCDTSVSPYFEETAFHPDLLLREFIILAHPNVSLGKLRYYTGELSTHNIKQ